MASSLACPQVWIQWNQTSYRSKKGLQTLKLISWKADTLVLE